MRGKRKTFRLGEELTVNDIEESIERGQTG
jgi:hypothetical protein